MKVLRGMIIVALILAVTITVFAGPPDGKGNPGTPDIPDTGELFGDLYVIQRELVNGVPYYDAYKADGTWLETTNGAVDGAAFYCVRPISGMDGVVGTVTFTEGEPFELLTYIDEAGDLVECELPETYLDYVQEVDFGRMNVGRSPDEVLLHSFDEAINTMNSAVEMRLGPAGRIQLFIPDPDVENPDPEVEGDYYWKTIDSPLENLGLYKQLMLEGHWVTPEETYPVTRGNKPDGKGSPDGEGPSSDPRPVLSEQAGALLAELGFPHLALLELGTVIVDGVEVPVTTHTAIDLENNELLMAANLMAGAADKGSVFTIDKVVYLNSIYGINSLSTNATVIDAVDKKYFNFGEGRGEYQRSAELGNTHRWVDQCFDEDEFGAKTYRPGEAWVLGFEGVAGNELDTAWDDLVWKASCVDIGEVVFGAEDASGSDIVGYARAATDAIGILTYVHNYHVPEDLGADYPILNPPPESLQSLLSHPMMPEKR